MDARIGVGVSTYNRPKHLELFNSQLERYWGFKENGIEMYAVPYIANDGIVSFDKAKTLTRKGIAYRKNECLKALKDCDYIFLFDDDCFPIKEGWAEFFIDASKWSGQGHFMYLKETPTIKQTDKFSREGKQINIYNNSAGCMMFFTKECIEKVGAYNPKYGIYGFEHSGYSERIHKAGLTPLGAFTCPAGAGEYIYSLDLDNHLSYNKDLKHEPSMAKEIQNIPVYIQRNKDIYLQDTEIYIPL